MPLQIGLDISAIPYNRGVSRYTSNLIRALYQHKQDVTLRVFGTSFRQRAILKQFVHETTPGSYAKILPHPVKVMNVLWNDLHLFSPEHLLGKIDVFHSWEMQPPLKQAALVSTIHDLAMLRFPHTADPYVLSMHEKSWKHLKKEAQAIIAVSEATRKDIVELLQIDPARVYVVHEAMTTETEFHLSSVRKQEVLDQFGLHKPYILFIGTQEPRKNLATLIKAWRPLKKEFDLVLAGAPGWETIKREEGLQALGVVSNEQLVGLYEGAVMLAYPSLYEGFGLPILDAFYHHIPVVTSNISSMPEIAGSAAVLVDPKESESIQKGIEKAAHDRATLIKKGKEQLKNFSWNRVAQQTIEVYHKAVETKKEQSGSILNGKR